MQNTRMRDEETTDFQRGLDRFLCLSFCSHLLTDAFKVEERGGWEGKKEKEEEGRGRSEGEGGRMEWGRGNDKPQVPPWAELGCLGGDGRAHAPPPWLRDVKHITCPLHPFLTVWRAKNRPWSMVLDQQGGACLHGSSPMVSGARAPLGNCVNVLLFLQSCFFLI